MERVVQDVRSAVNGEAWYSALALALALPDICGYVESPRAGSGARYAAWFDREVGPCYSVSVAGSPPVQFLTGNDCYAMRCAFLHQGEFDISDQRAREVLDRFRFVVPKSGVTIHNNRLKNTLQLQVSKFCEDVCVAVESWLVRARGRSDQMQRLAQLASIEFLEYGNQKWP